MGFVLYHTMIIVSSHLHQHFSYSDSHPVQPNFRTDALVLRYIDGVVTTGYNNKKRQLSVDKVYTGETENTEKIMEKKKMTLIIVEGENRTRYPIVTDR